MSTATITINGVELQVQCLLANVAEDDSCPGIAGMPVIADIKTWDPAVIGKRANDIAQEFNCRKGDKADAKWCLSRMDADSGYSKLYREAKTLAEWEEEQSKNRRAFLRGEVS